MTKRQYKNYWDATSTVTMTPEQYNEWVIGMQKVDCNCNDCAYLIRDTGKTTKGAIKTGTCSKTGERRTFLQGHCQLDTQECFVHRRDVR